MNLQRQSLRIGGLAVLFALLLRLGGSGIVQQVSDFLNEPTISSWIIYSRGALQIKHSSFIMIILP